jgi:hypothetical protein
MGRDLGHAERKSLDAITGAAPRPVDMVSIDNC